MKTLRESLSDYLALRRALGARLERPAASLRNFVAFAQQRGDTFITTDLALSWATASTRASPATQAAKLADLRRFAAWLSTIEPRTEVPPEGLLPVRYRRRPPYIYTNEQVEQLIGEAARLPSPLGLRGPTYATLFGLLATCGLRLGEAVALDSDDVDLGGGVLRIRRAKFGQSRFVPLHESTQRAIERYLRIRDQRVPRPKTTALFVNDKGSRVTQCSARYNFIVVSRSIGLRPQRADGRRGHGPRLHDLRHRLAAKTMLRWYREGRDVERELPRLSTFLGHVHVADTYWYIEAVPELLQLASDRASRPKGEP